jgi:hypothetical protein
MRRPGLAAAVACGAMLAAVGIPAAAGAQAAVPSTIAPAPWIPEAPAVPQPPTQLFGVFCPSAKDCWAVGEVRDGTADANQMLHWNGTKWRSVPVPNLAGTTGGAVNELDAVRCLTARDCWAVGGTSKDDVTFSAEALHWNGTSWSKKPVPQPGGTGAGDATFLSDSACVSAKDCWAVGAYGIDEGVTVRLSNLVLHWNGRKWRKAAGIPNPAGSGAGRVNYLAGVRCFSRTSCVADGENLSLPPASTVRVLNEALRWNGRKWSRMSTPNPGGMGDDKQNELDALACGSSKSCWGVGFYGTIEPTLTSLNEILYWNGVKWASAKSVPDPGGTGSGAFNQLDGATCSSPGNCWALGSYGITSGAKVNEALQWTGAKWRLVKTPDPAGTAMNDSNTLNAARCPSATDCWAVGSVEQGNGVLQNEILHWNGTKWTVFT